MAREKVSGQYKTINFGDEDGALGEGEEFAGYYTGTKLVDTKYGKDRPVYTFRTEGGEDVEVWGSATLNTAMSRVGLGNMTWITYKGLGEKKRGQNPAKLFEVEQDKSNRIEVEAPKVSFRDEAADESEDDVDQAPAARMPAGSATDRTAKLNALLGKR